MDQSGRLLKKCTGLGRTNEAGITELLSYLDYEKCASWRGIGVLDPFSINKGQG